MKKEYSGAAIGCYMVPGEARRTGRPYVQHCRTCNKTVAAAPIPRGSVQMYIAVDIVMMAAVAAEDNNAGDASVVAVSAAANGNTVVAPTAARTAVDENVDAIAAAAGGLFRHSYRGHCRPGLHLYRGLDAPHLVLPDCLRTSNQHDRPFRQFAPLDSLHFT